MPTKNRLIFSSILPLVLIILSISSILMAESKTPSTESSSSSEAKVHIVYTEKPEDQEPEEHHVKVLSSVLGSEDAAKEAILYSYKHAASGFSAKLTPEQVEELKKHPDVLQVVPSQTLHLHTGVGRVNV